MEIWTDIRVTLSTFSAVATSDPTWRLALSYSMVANYWSTKNLLISTLFSRTIIVFPSWQMTWVSTTSISSTTSTVSIHSAVPSQTFTWEGTHYFTNIGVTILTRTIWILITITSIWIVAKRLIDGAGRDALTHLLITIFCCAVVILCARVSSTPVLIACLIQNLPQRKSYK